MKPEIKARLIAALRSGEYKQTRGVMKKGGCFCIAGVLCDLYAKDQGVSWVPHYLHSDRESLLGEWSGPPQEVKDWADVNRRCYGPDEVYEDEVEMIMTWNDGYRLTFQQMADLLEKVE